MVFDSHTHIHFSAFNKDREAVIKRAQEEGVKMITVGTNLRTSQEAITIAEKYPDDIWATVGIHPNEIPSSVIPSEAQPSRGISLSSKVKSTEISRSASRRTRDDGGGFDIIFFRKLAKHPKVVAIGECGLDYYRLGNTSTSSANNILAPERNEVESKDNLKAKDLQKEVFLEQVKLAQELNKPLMIHCRSSKGTDDAYEDLVVILNGMKNLKDPSSTTKVGTQDDGGVIMHFFAGSLMVAKKLFKLGCYFTFGGVITFVRDYDEVIKFLPLEKIMLETDAPYVAPEPYRGQRNEPAYVIEVAQKLAEIKEISYDEVIKQTTANVKKIFKI